MAIKCQPRWANTLARQLSNCISGRLSSCLAFGNAEMIIKSILLALSEFMWVSSYPFALACSAYFCHCIFGEFAFPAPPAPAGGLLHAQNACCKCGSCRIFATACAALTMPQTFLYVFCLQCRSWNIFHILRLLWEPLTRRHARLPT